MRRSCCVLDVDETLVHTYITPFRSTYVSPTTKDRIYHITVDGTKMWGIKRPYLPLLIACVFNIFDDVGVWSAGTREYIETLLPIIFGDKKDKLLFVWTRENCLETDGIYYKPLELLFRAFTNLNKHNTLIFDDRIDVSMYNLDNHVLIPLFSPHVKTLTLHDDCLIYIIKFFRESKKPYVQALKEDSIFEGKCQCNEEKCELDEEDITLLELDEEDISSSTNSEQQNMREKKGTKKGTKTGTKAATKTGVKTGAKAGKKKTKSKGKKV